MTILEKIKARLNENDEWRGFAKYYPKHEMDACLARSAYIRNVTLTVRNVNGDDYICWIFFGNGNTRCATNCHLMTHFQADVKSIADLIQEIYADLRAENDKQD